MRIRAFARTCHSRGCGEKGGQRSRPAWFFYPSPDSPCHSGARAGQEFLLTPVEGPVLPSRDKSRLLAGAAVGADDLQSWLRGHRTYRRTAPPLPQAPPGRCSARANIDVHRSIAALEPAHPCSSPSACSPLPGCLTPLPASPRPRSLLAARDQPTATPPAAKTLLSAFLTSAPAPASPACPSRSASLLRALRSWSPGRRRSPFFAKSSAPLH